jgi:hypothetical protein
MKQINQLPEATSASNNDLLAFQTNEGITKRITKANFLQGLSNGGSSLQFDLKFNGDKQGLFYYLGTNAYTQSFTNPANNGTIVTSQSSIYTGGYEFSKCFDRGNGLFHTLNEANQWGKIDLGISRAFLLKYYSIRARGDSDGHHLRHWQLQGSNDDSGWTTLDTQTNRTDLIFNNWLAFDLRENSTAYRYFRLLQNGMDSHGLTYLVLGELEFYGNLI